MKSLPSAVLFCLGAALSAQAAFQVSPYLQNLTDTSIVVRWLTAAPESGRVEYGLSPAYGQDVSHPDATVEHELTLGGLMSDTTYHYRAISGADTSPDSKFATHITTARTFRFLAYGDTHGDSAANQAVVERMKQVAPGPQFLIHAGDLTATGSASLYRTFFNLGRALLGRAPVFPVPGNRDVDSLANWYRFLCLPNNERWFTFREGNAAFHALCAYDSLVPTSGQYDWLLAELLADSALGVRHVFAFVHTPPYTTNTSYAGNAVIRQYICPLFERFGVAIVFCGHVHAYEHSLVNGVHYITTGGGGASLSTGWNPAQPWTVYREATYEFVRVDVTGDTVRSVGIRANGSEFDTLAIVRGQVGCGDSRERRPARVQGKFGSLRLMFTTHKAAPATALLCDAAGRGLARQSWGILAAGEHLFEWDGRALAPGAYFCLLRTGATVSVLRLTVPR